MQSKDGFHFKVPLHLTKHERRNREVLGEGLDKVENDSNKLVHRCSS